jgi:hypothetical protein
MSLRVLVRNILISFRLIPRPEFVCRTVHSHPSPEEIVPGEIIVVGSDDYQKWACFRCPGGCEEVILLSLRAPKHPSWRVSSDWLQRPSLYPSVRQLNECKCHFWIRKGQVSWCEDSNHCAK